MSTENEPTTSTSKAAKPADAGRFLVIVQAPYRRVELTSDWTFDAGDEPREVSAEEAKSIRDAAQATRTGGLVIVEKGA